MLFSCAPCFLLYDMETGHARYAPYIQGHGVRLLLLLLLLVMAGEEEKRRRKAQKKEMYKYR